MLKNLSQNQKIIFFVLIGLVIIGISLSLYFGLKTCKVTQPTLRPSLIGFNKRADPPTSWPWTTGTYYKYQYVDPNDSSRSSQFSQVSSEVVAPQGTTDTDPIIQVALPPKDSNFIIIVQRSESSSGPWTKLQVTVDPDDGTFIDTQNPAPPPPQKINCCTNGVCAQKTPDECKSGGGTVVSDCSDCKPAQKVNCCNSGGIQGICTNTETSDQCTTGGGKVVPTCATTNCPLPTPTSAPTLKGWQNGPSPPPPSGACPKGASSNCTGKCTGTQGKGCSVINPYSCYEGTNKGQCSNVPLHWDDKKNTSCDKWCVFPSS
jgi:hypothetical protein